MASKSKVHYIGFYGCHVHGTLIRVRWSGPNRQSRPRDVVVDCPGCEQRHRVQPLWRRPASAGELDTAMVDVS